MGTVEVILIQVVVRVVCGVIAAAIASSKGRNVFGWFVIGFLITCIGIIIVAVLSNLKQDQAYREHAERERHRLREQLRQEQLKSEALRRYSMARLDAHDGALGMDTRSIDALPSAQPVGQLPNTAGVSSSGQLTDGSQLSAGGSGASQAAWYYENSGEVMGPTSETEIQRMLQSGQITAETLVWAEGLADWAPAGEIGRFRPMTGT